MPEKDEYVDKIEQLLSIDPNTIKLRVATIQEKLDNVAVGLREEIEKLTDESTTDLDVMEMPVFKTWMICNMIIEQSQGCIGDDTYNRMLYFMYEEKNGSIPELLNQYDLETSKNTITGELTFELVIMETETYEEPE